MQDHEDAKAQQCEEQYHSLTKEGYRQVDPAEKKGQSRVPSVKLEPK